MPTTLDGRHTCTNDCQSFNLLAWTWCVTYAQQLIKENPDAATLTDDGDISKADTFVGLNQAPDTVALIGYRNLNREHAATVDITTPVIVAAVIDERGVEQSKTIIDGWHRVYKARTQGLDTLPAYILSAEASNASRIPTFVR